MFTQLVNWLRSLQAEPEVRQRHRKELQATGKQQGAPGRPGLRFESSLSTLVFNILKHKIMERYFIVKISVSRFQDDGSQKMVNKMYLIDALSFTEAETRITEEIRKQTSGDLVITDISRSKYSELLLRATVSKKFYRVKTNFVTLSEKTGKEKKTAYYYLVQADEIDEAKESFENFMKGTISDYEIEGISETKINEVFIFDVNKV